VAHGKTPLAHKGLIHAAKVIAATARALIQNPDALRAAKFAHQAQLIQTPYEGPIPNDIKPPIKTAP
jgi:aminobenzoyl-glutamate utilization protein B